MALADGYDLVARYDPRRLGELAGDGSDPLPAAIPTLPVVVTAVADAQDEVIDAAVTAARYTLADLSDPLLIITPPATGGTGLNLVKRLICDLAFGFLVDRRGYGAGEEAALTPRVEKAREMLEQLKMGLRVLNTLTHPAAGLPVVDTNLPYVPGLTGEACRFFGIDPGRRRW